MAAGLGQQAIGVRPHRLEVEREPEVASRALQPSQVLFEGVGDRAVDPDDLEHAIPDFQNGNIKGPAAQVIDCNFFILFLVQPVSQ